MKYDVIIAGVGGQGVLSVAVIIAGAAMEEGLAVKQSEVHGMAQRGGAVQSNLRLASGPIASDMVPRGCASMILGMEPLESLRYLDFLAAGGVLVTATHPVANIPDYPEMPALLAEIRRLPRAVLVDAESPARREGNPQGINVVMVGAASHWLPVQEATLRRCIERRFAARGAALVEANLRLFEAGRRAAAERRLGLDALRNTRSSA
jgi:indolepyruvate ferredoxin oxidoreductase beta subunit